MDFPFVMEIQSDLLNRFAERVCVPLVREGAIPGLTERFNPTVVVHDQALRPYEFKPTLCRTDLAHHRVQKLASGVIIPVERLESNRPVALAKYAKTATNNEAAATSNGNHIHQPSRGAEGRGGSGAGVGGDFGTAGS